MPPSLGYKPRTFCSPECCRAASRPPKCHATACRICGEQIVQSSGPGKTRLICSPKCRSEAKKRKPTRQSKCQRCAVSFESTGRRFCSQECRSAAATKPPDANCDHCGKPFKKKKARQRFCSEQCRLASPAIPARKYVCLNCEKPFTRKRFPSGNVSCQKKYCSRDCAFEARRLRKPCAERPSEATRRLAGWFLSWGDDQWPVVSSCPDCGRRFCRQRDSAGETHEKCPSCRSVEIKPERQCEGCGSALNAGRRLCSGCADKRQKEQRRRYRRAHRKKHGSACTFRQRCKKYGTPYTKVSKQAVMERDGWGCQLCGVALLRSFTTIVGTRTPHPRSPTIDHIVPLSFGPTSPGHVFDNCQAACWACNCERGTQDADSFARRKATG